MRIRRDLDRARDGCFGDLLQGWEQVAQERGDARDQDAALVRGKLAHLASELVDDTIKGFKRQEFALVATGGDDRARPFCSESFEKLAAEFGLSDARLTRNQNRNACSPDHVGKGRAQGRQGARPAKQRRGPCPALIQPPRRCRRRAQGLQDRARIRSFVGCSDQQDLAQLGQLRRHLRNQLANRYGILVLLPI